MSDAIPMRADARRNQQALLAAAAEVFVRSGVDAPVREIAAEAGVGMGTIYRHFPTRGDLIVAVYRHQVEACAESGPVLLAEADSPLAALAAWMQVFADFLVTKHGLATVLKADDTIAGPLHRWFLDTLVPVCADLLGAAVAAGEARDDVEPIALLRAAGNLCFDHFSDDRYDARRMVELLIAGLGTPQR